MPAAKGSARTPLGPKLGRIKGCQTEAPVGLHSGPICKFIINPLISSNQICFSWYLIQVVAPAVLAMVADLKFLKSKVKELSQRWEIIQIHKGLEADGGSFEWDSPKHDKSDSHYKPEEPKYPRGAQEEDYNQQNKDDQVNFKDAI